jgi:Tol biopolymer transport system component
MNDIKELFDMVTKQTEPDLDSWKQQEDRQRRAARNRRNGALAIAAAIVLSGAFAVASMTGGGEPAPPMGDPTEPPVATPAPTHQYVNIATGERAPVLTDLTDARLPEVSPDGQRIVFGTCCGFDPLYVATIGGSEWRSITERTTLTPPNLDGYAAAWIDDDTILFQGRQAGTQMLGDLYTMDISTGETVIVTDLPDENNGAWIVASDLSPDGTTVLFHLPRGRGENAEWDLWTAPLAGGEPTLLRQDAGFATYTPDGSIVYLDHPVPFESDALWIMDGDGSNARSLVEGGTITWPAVSPDGARVAYAHDALVEVVDIGTGEVTEVGPLALDSEPAWFDDQTLIIAE